MSEPARVNLWGYRTAPFFWRQQIVNFNAGDLTDARLEVRSIREVNGAPIVQLTLQPAGDQGISYVVDNSGDEPISTLRFYIEEANVESLFPIASSLGLEAGSDVEYVYDLQIQTLDITRKVIMWGLFTMRAGVTA